MIGQALGQVAGASLATEDILHACCNFGFGFCSVSVSHSTLFGNLVETDNLTTRFSVSICC